ncbi:uncharacterized protein LOC135943792 [Cloeon dipterum]|uniref:uncharacterized protein LOC135943792 n=1 Tax=Cloeon dipterum TaxID=197152 RepID=UPI00321FC475
MNFWSLLTLLIILIFTVQQSEPNKIKLKSLKTVNSNKKLSQNKAGRRIAIIRCCGFKRCLPVKNATKTRSSVIPTSSTLVSKNEGSVATASFPNVATNPTGSSSSETTFDSKSFETTEVEMENSTALPVSSSNIFDSSTPEPEAAKEKTVSDVITQKNNFISTESVPTSESINLSSGNIASNFDSTTTNGAASVATATSLAISTTRSLNLTNSVISTKSTGSLTTNSKASATTKPTTTTLKAIATTTTTRTTLKTIITTAKAISCSLTCSNFNTFQAKSPLPKSPQSDGSVQKASKCNRQYFVSTVAASRNEAASRCTAMNMTLLTVTSLEELDCLASLKDGTFWTSGSNEDANCDLEKKYAWCSTGYNISTALVSSPSFWLPTNAPPSALERCLAVVFSTTPQKGMVHKNCVDQLPYICQFTVDCPRSHQCVKNTSLFDSKGDLMNKSSHGLWIDIGNYTYLFGNKPVFSVNLKNNLIKKINISQMSWLSNYLYCCALGMETLNIDNAAEQLGLTGMTLGKNSNNWKANFNYWTAGTKKGSSEFSWCEPTGPTIFDQGLTWEAGQPDNAAGNESCVHFRFILNSTGTVMTDRNCNSKFIFACKVQIIRMIKDLNYFDCSNR